VADGEGALADAMADRKHPEGSARLVWLHVDLGGLDRDHIDKALARIASRHKRATPTRALSPLPLPEYPHRAVAPSPAGCDEPIVATEGGPQPQREEKLHSVLGHRYFAPRCDQAPSFGRAFSPMVVRTMLRAFPLLPLFSLYRSYLTRNRRATCSFVRTPPTSWWASIVIKQ
jgi:hypothetical protein